MVSGRILLKFELNQAYMHILVSCKNEEDLVKKEGSVHIIAPIVSLLGFFPGAQGQLTPQYMV